MWKEVRVGQMDFFEHPYLQARFTADLNLNALLGVFVFKGYCRLAFNSFFCLVIGILVA